MIRSAMPLSAALTRMLHEAETKAMERLLESWDRQIAARAKELERINQQKTQEALAAAALNRLEQRSGRRRELLEHHHSSGRRRDAAKAGSLELTLLGLAGRAAAGEDVSASIPTGVRVAADFGGTTPAAISALVAEVRSADEPVRDDRQRSALWALGAGLMPHPGDLAHLLERSGRDPAWRAELAVLCERLDNAHPARGPLPVSARMAVASERLGALRAESQLLTAYGPERLLTLVVRPHALETNLSSPPPGGPRMGRAALDAVLDGLFSPPRAHR